MQTYKKKKIKGYQRTIVIIKLIKKIKKSYTTGK